MKKLVSAAVVLVVVFTWWRTHSEKSKNATLAGNSGAHGKVADNAGGDGIGPLLGDTKLQGGSSSFNHNKSNEDNHSGDDPIYGNDRAGKRIGRLMDLTKKLNDRAPAATSQHQDFLNRLRRDPHGYEDVRTVIERIQGNPDYQLEAAGLLEILAEDPASREVAHSIAEKQMRDVLPDAAPLPSEAQTEEELNRSLTTDQSMVPPIVAYEVFLKTAHNEQEAYDGTLRVVTEQPNHNVRTSMIVTFSESYPQRKDELLNALRANGVKLIDMNHSEN